MAASYQRPAEADKKIHSALTVIKALLALEIDERMKRKFLSNCLWQITQAEGENKFSIRYRSKAARNAPKKELRHEHVIPRKKLVKDLIDNTKDFERIAKSALGCVVTKEEHERLSKLDRLEDPPQGWDRYRQAKIVVWDMATDSKFEFPDA